MLPTANYAELVASAERILTRLTRHVPNHQLDNWQMVNLIKQHGVEKVLMTLKAVIENKTGNVANFPRYLKSCLHGGWELAETGQGATNGKNRHHTYEETQVTLESQNLSFKRTVEKEQRMREIWQALPVEQRYRIKAWLKASPLEQLMPEQILQRSLRALEADEPDRGSFTLLNFAETHIPEEFSLPKPDLSVLGEKEKPVNKLINELEKKFGAVQVEVKPQTWG